MAYYVMCMRCMIRETLDIHTHSLGAIHVRYVNTLMNMCKCVIHMHCIADCGIVSYCIRGQFWKRNRPYGNWNLHATDSVSSWMTCYRGIIDFKSYQTLEKIANLAIANYRHAHKWTKKREKKRVNWLQCKFRNVRYLVAAATAALSLSNQFFIFVTIDKTFENPYKWEKK